MSTEEEKWEAANHAMRTIRDKLIKAQTDIMKLAAERDNAKSALSTAETRVQTLENSIRRVRNAFAIMSWNEDPVKKAYAKQVSDEFESLMKGPGL